MSVLRIFLLGSAAFFWNDQPVNIRRRIQRALLIYLAMHPEGVLRDDLALLFWQAGSDERKNLREALSKLRAELPAENLIETDRERVRLRQELVYVDALDFLLIDNQTVRIARQTPSNLPLPDAVCQQMNKAVSLWRSPHFLAGSHLLDNEEIIDWLRSQSSLLETKRMDMLERLASHYSASGDPVAALHPMKLSLEMDELNPDMQWRYLSSLVSLDRRSEARNQASHMCALFKRENIELPTRLEKLCEQLHQLTNSHLEHIPLWLPSIVTQVPFVGRDGELKELLQAYPRGGMVVIHGEAGAGKTRLIYEMYKRLEPSPRLLLAPVSSLQRNLPFLPLVDMLRQFILPEEWRQLEVVWVMQLLRLLPELSVLRPDMQTPQEAGLEETRALVFEALHRLLLLVSRRQRVLLFVDDAQWCDESTLGALAYLVDHNFFCMNGLLVLTYRTEEENPALDVLLNQSRPGNFFTSLSLTSLLIEDVSRLAEYVLGQSVQAGVVERLMLETGGNAFFVLETLRALLEFAPIQNLEEYLNRLPLASGVHRILRERMRSLDSRSRQVLSSAAVIGSKFTPQILEQVTGLSAEHITQALEELEKVHFIHMVPAGVHGMTFAFDHEKTREVLLLELSPVRRRLFHQRVARALEAGGTDRIDSMSVVLAEHYENCGEVVSAMHFWTRAARYAFGMYSRQSAYTFFRRAERLLLNHRELFTEEEIYSLFYAWDEVAEDLLDTAELAHLSSSLLKLGQQRRSPLLVGAALGSSGAFSLLKGQVEQAQAELQQALQYLEPSPNSLLEQMAVYTRLGLLMAQLGRHPEATQIFSKVLVLGESSSDPRAQRWMTTAMYFLALLLTVGGYPRKAYEMARQRLQGSRHHFYTPGAIRLVNVMSMALYYMGRYDEALELCHQEIPQAGLNQSVVMAGWFHVVAARCELAHGHVDAAWEHVLAAQHSADETPEVAGEVWSVVGDIYRSLGQLKRACEFYRLGAVNQHSVFIYLNNMHRLGAALAEAGELLESEQVIEQVVQMAQNAEAGAVLYPALHTQLLLQFAAGRTEEIAGRILGLRAEVSERGLARLPEQFDLLLARVWMEEGRQKEAAVLVLSVVNNANQMGDPWLEITAYQQLADIVGTSGEQGQAACLRVNELVRYIDGYTLNPTFIRTIPPHHDPVG